MRQWTHELYVCVLDDLVRWTDIDGELTFNSSGLG
jgi:hypothetical protein